MHDVYECEHVYHVDIPESEDKLLESVFPFHLLCRLQGSTRATRVMQQAPLPSVPSLSQFLVYQRKTSTERKERRSVAKWGWKEEIND